MTTTPLQLAEGEYDAGIILGKNGESDYRLIGLPGELEKADWNTAKAWAASIGGELPTRRELCLLRANAREQFKDNWYWSGEQLASNSDNAWVQNFFNGLQNFISKSSQGRARAVRRIYSI